MAQTYPEIAKEIVIAWLGVQASQPTNAAAKSEFSSKDAQKNGEYIGEVYKAVLKAVEKRERRASP